MVNDYPSIGVTKGLYEYQRKKNMIIKKVLKNKVLYTDDSWQTDFSE